MLAHDSEAYLVGGLSSARTAPWQVAGQVVEGGISGVLFDERVVIATGLSQGCAPIGPVRRVTRADRNTIIELDGRPALDCFKEDIGDLLARDLRRVAGLIFAGLPVPGSDCGDYLVRNLVSIDTKQGWIAIADEVGIGDSLLFCSRDRGIAARDFDRMLNDLKRRGAGRAQAGVYFSCVGRGPGFFSEPTEMAMIGAALGDIPIVGFFGNGEITYDRIYGHSGVLALFL
jgi:small ligand-binding sensory domain FIST